MISLIFSSPAHPNLASVAVVVLSLAAPISFFGPRTLLTHFCLFIPMKKTIMMKNQLWRRQRRNQLLTSFIKIPSQYLFSECEEILTLGLHLSSSTALSSSTDTLSEKFMLQIFLYFGAKQCENSQKSMWPQLDRHSCLPGECTWLLKSMISFQPKSYKKAMWVLMTIWFTADSDRVNWKIATLKILSWRQVGR